MKPLRLIITIAIVFIAFAIYYPFSPAAVQARGMAKAKMHAAKITPALHADPRFFQVGVDSYTGNSGMIVFGKVRTGADQAALKTFIESTAPPTPVWYVAHVDPDSFNETSFRPSFP